MIKINEKYYIDADINCYALKEKKIVTDKDGNTKDGFKDLGYYTTLEGIAKGLLKTELRQYIKESENASVQDLLKKLDELDKFIKEKLKDI